MITKGELQKELWARGYTQKKLSKIFDRSVSYVAKRWRDEDDWTISEEYRLLELIEQPSENFLFCFPK